METEKEITLEQVKEALEEALKDCPLKEELLTGNLIHVHVDGESLDFIMDKDAYEAEMDFAIRKDIESHDNMVDSSMKHQEWDKYFDDK